MFTTTCIKCNRAEVPFTECYRAHGQLICDTCFEREHPHEDDRKRQGIARLADMNVCAFCGVHKSMIPLKDMQGSPVCTTCSENLISRPFPLWVKAFFAGVMVLVVASIAWNWRYFQAKSTLTAINVSIDEGDLDGVIAGLHRYNALLPEKEYDMRAAMLFYTGIRALYQDSSALALELFDQVEGIAPGVFEVEPYMLNARIGLAFDTGDHDGFLNHCKKYVEIDQQSSRAYAYLASAFACKYVVSNDESYRDSTYAMLATARSFSADNELDEYEPRILYRLHSREIITAKDYYERFPEGWKP